MNLAQTYYPIRISLRDVTASVMSVAELAGIVPAMVNAPETVRLMLADYFYGELENSPFPGFTVNNRTFSMAPGSVHNFDLQFQTLVIQELDQTFWFMADMIGQQVLKQTAEYQHRPSDCYYEYHVIEDVLCVYVPVIPELSGHPNIAPVPISAVLLTCRQTLPPAMRALLVNDPIINNAHMGLGEY